MQNLSGHLICEGKFWVALVLQFWYELNWTKGGLESIFAKSSAKIKNVLLEMWVLKEYSCRG
jgi:hypothetical protein